jgi:hypothetical protein
MKYPPPNPRRRKAVAEVPDAEDTRSVEATGGFESLNLLFYPPLEAAWLWAVLALTAYLLSLNINI